MLVHIMNALRGSRQPIATVVLAGIVWDEKPNLLDRVWCHLRTLEKAGRVRRVHRSPKGTTWAVGKAVKQP